MANPAVALLQDLSSIEDPKLIEWDWISENFWEDIVPAIQGHIFLSFVSVAIALAISLPTGVLVYRYRKAYPPVTLRYGVALLHTSLALFGILISIPGITGPGNHHRARRLLAPHPDPQHRREARRRPGGDHRRRARDGIDGQPDPLPGRVPAGSACDRCRHPHCDRHDNRDRDDRRLHRRRRPGKMIFDGINRSFPTMIITGAVLATVSPSSPTSRYSPWSAT